MQAHNTCQKDVLKEILLKTVMVAKNGDKSNVDYTN